MTPEELSAAISACLTEAVAAGEISVEVPETVRVDRPKSREHGDWATNIALQLGKKAGEEVTVEAPAGSIRYKIVEIQ